MNQKEIRELIDYLIEKDVTEFELERGDVKLRIKRGAEVHYAPAAPHVAPVAAAVGGGGAPAAGSGVAVSAGGGHAPPEASEEGLHIIQSPIVGTFYEAPSPGSPPFVKPGDAVENGQVLCIIEAMKLMNEIESDVAGEVVKRFVNNGQPVEYGQKLFAIRPRT
jgi:acetyl-CoA carboxylase biotin carboxyl carrier protein